MKRHLASLALVALVCLPACSASKEQSAVEAFLNSPQCTQPANDPSAMHTRPGEVDLYGFQLEVTPLRACSETGQALWIVSSGHRRFQHTPAPFPWETCRGHEDPTQAPSECLQVCDGPPMPDEPCTLIEPRQLGAEVTDRIKAAGHHASLGFGACGERHGEPGFDRWALIVHDWKAVDIAIETLTDRMRAWRAEGRMRIVVKPVTCGVPG